MQQNELPEGWTSSTLNEVSDDIKYGYTASAEKEPIGPHLLRITDIQEGKVNWENVPFCKIEENHVSKYELKPNDIVFARTGATTGKSYLITSCPTSVFASYLIRLRPNESINPVFLSFFFNTPDYWSQISQNVAGIAQPNCNATKLKELVLPLPPLPEQHRIVAAIEALFARLDATNERLDRVPGIMKNYRQAVLAAACDGRLTEDWREEQKDLPDARELQDRIYRTVKEAANKSFKKIKTLESLSETELEELPEIPENWLWVKLGDLTLGVEYGTSAKSNKSGKVPVLRMGNIRNGRFDWSDLVYTSDEAEIEKYLLSKDDVLFNRTNSPDLVGKTAIYKGEKPAIFAGYLIRINQLPMLVVADYLNYYLNTPAAKLYGSSVRTDGVNQSNINGEKLRNYPFPFCSLPEQQEIVRRVDALFAFADSIEAKVAVAREKTEKLRQAILSKAFSGELVFIEAEIVRRENKD